jgi:hypothetical protein
VIFENIPSGSCSLFFCKVKETYILQGD